eukprot:CAMPEP_0176491138 /NCGR_PEP_ID=MMETSP0200_2-20121128/8267_1 /TAXON_ID=947934 /ORGANISM="Chaetoceros sp., Strain GSL56" /LENGTH=1160 /DNA_ID=CAMNT_0017888537 /DNA_START=635 /DNA_END=4117 /DNA_ORIENTATION=-
MMSTTETDSTLDTSMHNQSIQILESSSNLIDSSKRNVVMDHMNIRSPVPSRKRPRQPQPVKKEEDALHRETVPKERNVLTEKSLPSNGDFPTHRSHPVKLLPSRSSINQKAISDTCKSEKRAKTVSHNHGDYDPNIAYVPYTPTPPSPVRSIVSCDLDAGDSITLIDTIPYSQQEELDVQEGEQDGMMYDTAAIGRPEMVSPATSTTQALFESDAEVREQQLITSAIAHLPQNMQIYIRSLRIEASLTPMKPLVQRLLTHQNYNRKGTFNVPVDPVKMGLKDYFNIVKEPMDLGTVKNKLYTNVYHSHVEVARDVRLVFRNACLYNPPSHPVHEAAKHLSDYFEDAYAHILSKSAPINFESSNEAPSHQNNLKPVPDSMSGGQRPKHICSACLGRTCVLCNSGCLSLEPSLLICSGSSCTSTRIRRNTVYYCTLDGSKTWCQKCYPSLPTILPSDDVETTAHEILYKRDLLKRKNDEDVVERWIDCKKCKRGVHQMCAFADEFSCDRDNFICPMCSNSPWPRTGGSKKVTSSVDNSVYSFLTGTELPERIEDITHGTSFDARSLPRCSISDFIQTKVQERMQSLNCPTGAEETLTVRVISDCHKEFNIPDVVRHHFRMQEILDEDRGVKTYSKPPETVEYRSRAIALFQRIDGMDVCIFCMYVQEYDGASADDLDDSNQKKRVYLAYLDSVDHFRPRCLRSNIYHEFLAAYFASARARGFVNVHIWSCPPSRGNSFVFWAHPHSQRTPTKEHLLTWYHNVLSHAVNCGIITDVMSLYESNFQQNDKIINKDSSTSSYESTMLCPPLLDGDFWIEEANRIYSASITRWSRSKRVLGYKFALDEEGNFLPERAFEVCSSKCPAIQCAILLESCIMKHPNAAPFLRPVNTAALHLNDYHDVIEKPMDLGTILSKCLMGEYDEFHEFVSDLELTFTNAMRYNPEGHPIHTMAKDILSFVQKQLRLITEYWRDCGVDFEQLDTKRHAYIGSFQHLSMRLSTCISSKSLLSGAGSEDEIPCRNTTDGTVSDKSQLLFDGPDGIAKLMVGDDVWLLDKRHTYRDSKKKNTSSKKKDISFDAANSDGVRRETWLSDAVLTAVRSQRAVSFVCNLCPKPRMTDIEVEKHKMFTKYIEGFDLESCVSVPKFKGSKSITRPTVTETRHGLA